ncbi:hypothetical protein [Thermobrachium celere]|nr:hypothetical protein [Thermobrachium celere]GFR35190.1 hypothetical protein TCEA9_10020 [Thermobrachium celere]
MYYKAKKVDVINFKQPEDKEHRYDYSNTCFNITSAIRGVDENIKDGR